MKVEASIRVRCDGRENTAFFLPVLQIGPRDLLPALAELRLRLTQIDEPLRILERQGMKNHPVEKSKKRGVDGDAQRQDQDDDGTGAGSFPENSKRDREVLNHVGQ